MMRALIYLLGLLALANIIAITDGRAIIARATIEKRQANDPSGCNDDDDLEMIEDQDEDEEMTLDFNATEEQTEQDRQAVWRIVDGPVSRSRLLRITTRVSQLLRQPTELSDRPSRTPDDIDRAARNLIMALTNEDAPSSPEEVQPANRRRAQAQEEEFCETPSSNNQKRWRTIDSLARAIKMHDEGVKRSTIKNRYDWYDSQKIDSFRRCLSRASSEPGVGRATRAQVNDAVIRRFNETRSRGLTAHDDQLKEWGLELNREMRGPDNFRASDFWVLSLKRAHGIGGRKITKHVTKSQLSKEHKRQESIENFRATYRGINHYFPRHRIINTDQSGFNYEMVDQRTLERKGTRDVIAIVDSATKTSHSYTIQPTVTRDGRLIGKLFIVFNEDKDDFPPTIRERIIDQARAYGNLYVTASRSGKVSNVLIERWENEVLRPALNETSHSDAGSTIIDGNNSSQSTVDYVRMDDEAAEEHYRPDDEDFDFLRANFEEHVGNCWLYPWLNSCADGILQRGNETYLSRPHSLLLKDSLSSHASRRANMRLREHGIKSMIIPPGTTDYLQPLDISLFRQWKAFVKRITRQARIEGMEKNITSREGIMNLQSLVYNQLQAPMYNDLIRSGWRHLDPDFTELEYSVARPIMSIKHQFVKNSSILCEVEGCRRSAFLQCAHCLKHVCLKHFWERAHEHHDSPQPGTSGITRAPHAHTEDDDELDY